MNVKSAQTLAMFAIGASLLLASQIASAYHPTTVPEKASGPVVTYVNKSASPAIAGYQNVRGAEQASRGAQIVYVDQAHGQAIYSYPRVAKDIVTAFNVEYVDQAYGQAIYSYPHVGEPTGTVNVLDVVPLTE